VPTRHRGFSRTAAELATVPHSARPSLCLFVFVLLPVHQHSTQIRVAGMGPAEFEQLLLQGQCTIEDKTTRTGETTHWMPLLSVRPQFKPISLQTNLDPPFFAFCSPHPASLTQLDSGFNIQFLRCQFLRCPEGIQHSRHRPIHPRHQGRGFSRWIGKWLIPGTIRSCRRRRKIKTEAEEWTGTPSHSKCSKSYLLIKCGGGRREKGSLRAFFVPLFSASHACSRGVPRRVIDGYWEPRQEEWGLWKKWILGSARIQDAGLLNCWTFLLGWLSGLGSVSNIQNLLKILLFTDA
jgi:hypothetical protein